MIPDARKRFFAWLFAFIVAFWSMAVISYAICQTFEDVAKINSSVATALGLVLGLPTGATAVVALVRLRQQGAANSA